MRIDFTENDRIATIAACSSVGRLERPRGRPEPLGPVEWTVVAQWLHERNLRPAALLEEEGAASRFSGLKPKLASRIIDIPARADLVSLELEQLANQGVWTVVRFDDAYPKRWRERLRGLAPPVLFGVGPVVLLGRTPSLAIVGSRNINSKQAATASAIGRAAAKAGFLVVSGGARGSDRWGMFGALEGSRESLGILHGGLARDASKLDTWNFIEDGLLTLISHVHPQTGFVTGNAMSRNRYIHSLADATMVIATSEGKGGTWQGSIENLERGLSPLLVWTGEGSPAANASLVERGGIPIDRIPEDREAIFDLIGRT